MSTLDTTLSMLEVMPTDARVKMFEFTEQFFTSRKPANPFVPVSTKQVLSDLAESRRQIYLYHLLYNRAYQILGVHE